MKEFYIDEPKILDKLEQKREDISVSENIPSREEIKAKNEAKIERERLQKEQDQIRMNELRSALGMASNEVDPGKRLDANSEKNFEESISSSKSFDELINILRLGTDKIITSKESGSFLLDVYDIRRNIDEVRAAIWSMNLEDLGRDIEYADMPRSLNKITRQAGLRPKVFELLKKEVNERRK